MMATNIEKIHVCAAVKIRIKVRVKRELGSGEIDNGARKRNPAARPRILSCATDGITLNPIGKNLSVRFAFLSDCINTQEVESKKKYLLFWVYKLAYAMMRPYNLL